MGGNEEVKQSPRDNGDLSTHIEGCRDNLSVLEQTQSSQSSADSGWTEFNDRDYADWKRVRCAIEHEDKLTGQRITWLLSSQTVLITAYTLVFIQQSKPENSKEFAALYPVLFLIIIGFGILLSLHIRRLLTSGGVQLRKLENWWYVERDWGRAISKEEIDQHHPPLKGRPRSRFDRLVNAESLPWVFAVAWFALLIFSVGKSVQPLIGNAFTYWKDIALVFSGAIFLTFIVRKLIGNEKAPSAGGGNATQRSRAKLTKGGNVQD
jgi:hypothetical protein